MKTYYVRFSLDYETELDEEDDVMAEITAERMLEDLVRNGDIVLNEIENIVEWANEHAVIKIAERW